MVTRLTEHTEIDRDFITGLLVAPAGELDRLNSDYDLRRRIDASCRRLTHAAFRAADKVALARLHDMLALIYEHDLSAVPAGRTECETQPILRDIAARLERALLDEEMRSVPEHLLAACPRTGREYLRWLKSVVGQHRAARHPLYEVHLKEHATEADFKFFLAQETNLDPRFDDILALLQVGRQGAEKMELAGNYWDEMGNGKAQDVHTSLFQQTLRAIGIDPAYVNRNMLLEATISGNLSACLALSRRHYYKAVGFFGVTEYLVPRRFRSFTSGWRRNSLPVDGVAYHDLHIRIDAVHAAGWFKNVVGPLVDQDPDLGRDIAAGALIRLNSSERYLDAVLERLVAAPAAA